MKAHLDKLLFGIGFLLAAVAAGWAFLLAPGARTLNVRSLVGGAVAYEMEAPPVIEIRGATWSPPEAQSEDGLWVYDVFTPPKIYIDPETNLFSVVPFEEPETEAFGIEFAGITRELYRFQYEGFIEDDPSDARKSLIRIYDRAMDDSFLTRVGQSFPDKGIRVADFQVVRNLDENGLLARNEQLILEALETGERIELVSDTPRYADNVRVEFVAADSPNRRFSVSVVGDTFEFQGDRYLVTELDVDRGVVRIEKTDTQTGNRESRRFRADPPPGG